MTPDLPVPQPPSYKNRRGWLIAFGVVEILIACLFLLMIVGALLLPSPAAAPGSPPPPMSPVALKAFLTIFYSGIALLFLIIGVGSIRCKNWARLLMLGVSGVWLVSGLLGVVFVYLFFSSIGRQSKLPPDVERIVFAVTMAIMGIWLVLIPAVFLIFYSLKSVKATCLALTPQSPAAGSRLPVPLVVMTAWEGLQGLGILGLVIVPATALFGVVQRGFPAFLVLLTQTILAGIAVWLIVRRKLAGWVLALLKSIFFAISWIVTLASRDILQLYREMGMDDQRLQQFQQFPDMQSLMWIMTVPTIGAYVIFLVYARKYFPREN